MKDLFGKPTIEGKPLSVIRANEAKQLCKIDPYNFDCEKCNAECPEVNICLEGATEPTHIPKSSFANLKKQVEK